MSRPVFKTWCGLEAKDLRLDFVSSVKGFKNSDLNFSGCPGGEWLSLSLYKGLRETFQGVTRPGPTPAVIGCSSFCADNITSRNKMRMKLFKVVKKWRLKHINMIFIEMTDFLFLFFFSPSRLHDDLLHPAPPPRPRYVLHVFLLSSVYCIFTLLHTETSHLKKNHLFSPIYGSRRRFCVKSVCVWLCRMHIDCESKYH